jgi:hypothetical protein
MCEFNFLSGLAAAPRVYGSLDAIINLPSRAPEPDIDQQHIYLTLKNNSRREAVGGHTCYR